MKKMNRFSLLLILFCAIVGPQIATASDHDLEDALNHQFKDKILILRHPAKHESLRYDAQGKSLNQGQEGDWTVYGAARIQAIELSTHQIRLHGTRLSIRRAGSGLAVIEFARDKNANMAPPVKPSVKIEIGIDEPLTTVDQAQALFANVFALNKDDLLESVPEFWRTYLTTHVNDFDIRQGIEIAFQAAASDVRRKQVLQRNPVQPATLPESPAPLGAIFHVGGEVKSPRATFTPEPEFSEAARYEKFQGVVVVDLVVGQDGKAHSINVVKAMGLGLEERAVAAIQRWTFHPAMRNGEPVAVEMNVEVAFNLY